MSRNGQPFDSNSEGYEEYKADLIKQVTDALKSEVIEAMGPSAYEVPLPPGAFQAFGVTHVPIAVAERAHGRRVDADFILREYNVNLDVTFVAEIQEVIGDIVEKKAERRAQKFFQHLKEEECVVESDEVREMSLDEEVEEQVEEIHSLVCAEMIDECASKTMSFTPLIDCDQQILGMDVTHGHLDDAAPVTLVNVELSKIELPKFYLAVSTMISGVKIREIYSEPVQHEEQLYDKVYENLHSEDMIYTGGDRKNFVVAIPTKILKNNPYMMAFVMLLSLAYLRRLVRGGVGFNRLTIPYILSAEEVIMYDKPYESDEVLSAICVARSFEGAKFIGDHERLETYLNSIA